MPNRIKTHTSFFFSFDPQVRYYSKRLSFLGFVFFTLNMRKMSDLCNASPSVDRNRKSLSCCTLYIYIYICITIEIYIDIALNFCVLKNYKD